MQSFVYESLPARVIFGSGTVTQLKSEAERLGVRRALVLSTPGRGEVQAREIASLMGNLGVGIHAGAGMHTPVEATEQALQVVQELGVDAVVAVGGGSATGLGKAIALRTDLPQIVLPTTYAGSEMTPILGETRDGVKTTQRTLKVLPEIVIYDVDLTLGLPPAVAATSGMNAIAHAVEALYAKDSNPVISLVAEEGIRSLAGALPRITEDPHDSTARSVPVHSELITLGLLQVVAARARVHSKAAALWEEFEPPVGPKAKAWTKWFGRYLAAYVVDHPTRTFHSFRHSFKRACREARLGEEVHSALSGHAGGGVGRRYGRERRADGSLDRGISLQRLQTEIDKISYGELPLPKPDGKAAHRS